jgi:hypothetical protein
MERIKMKSRVTLVLSIILAVLTFFASAGGLFINSLYRDNTFVRAGWLGNDLVTLLLVLPIFIVAMVLAVRGSKRVGLVWIGILDYLLYNYAFYLFGGVFNRFFPIYVALFALSIYAMIFAFLDMDIKFVKEKLKFSKSFRWISGYMMFWAALLFAVWIGQWANFVITGDLPQMLVNTGLPVHVTGALDLSLVVSGLLLASVWLWKGRPWGYLLSAVFNVKGTLYCAVLTTDCFTQARAGINGAMGLLPLWLILGIACLTSSIILIRLYPENRVAYKNIL